MPFDLSAAAACRYCHAHELLMQFTQEALYQVRCLTCGARGPKDADRDQAVALWNPGQETPVPIPPPRTRHARA